MLPDACAACGEPTCCSTIWGAAEALADVAHAAVVDCAHETCCNGHGRIVSVGDPHWTGDYVAVWAAGVEASTPTPQQPKSLRFPTARVRYTIKLMETGWPMIQRAQQEIFIPAPESVTAVARHSYGHAEAMFRGVMNHLATNSTACGEWKGWQPLQPIPPAGGMVGWTMNVLLEMPWGSRG